MKRTLTKLLFCIFLIGDISLSLAAVTTQIENPRVRVGEAVKFILNLDGDQTDSTPDLTPLHKDFTIVGTQHSRNYTLINGQAHSGSQWIILLMPKKIGSWPVPQLTVGQLKTTSANIEVVQEKATQPASALSAVSQSLHPQGVMLRMRLDELQPFINQQVIVTVKLYNRHRLFDADYKPPQVEDAILIPLGEGRRYQANEQGLLYMVEEQQYALFPQKSGRLQIHPPSFQALIYDDVLPHRISKSAKTITLHVRPIPSAYLNAHWLPAKAISLHEKYKNFGDFTLGSTLERTINLKATGLPAQLLPALNFASANASFSVYPEKPASNNTFMQTNVIGSNYIKLTYLLKKTGSITIPPLQVKWFNTATGKGETATLPARTINVRPANVNTKALPPSPTSPDLSLSHETTHSMHLSWWLAIGFAVAWVITVAAWLGKSLKGRISIRRRRSKPTRKRALKYLQQACKDNNPLKARDALIKWANMQWPQENILNIGQIHQLIQHDVMLQQKIKDLEQALYCQTSSHIWDGTGLWRTIKDFQRNNIPLLKEDYALPPMNKL